MKTLRKLDSRLPDVFEIYDRQRDLFARIENQPETIVIRLARDGLSRTAKESFLRYLATEGFVPERYRWYHASSDQSQAKWVSDGSWVRFNHRRIRFAARTWAFLTWGRLLALGLFIVALAVSLWLKSHWVFGSI